MRDYQYEALSHDPLHGYIPFVSQRRRAGEAIERDLIDHAWVQRLRQIHQLQTAWWVFPTAEHTRFQHVLGVMHLASRAVEALYPSLTDVCPDVPSRPCVEALMRLAGLLHDVGHGPFGHFFDSHFLVDYRLTHESLGSAVICQRLGPLIHDVRSTPSGRLADDERVSPEHVAFLITRPTARDADAPKWLRFLRSLFSGIYTVDNMDFVLRDAYMSGYSARAFDLERLLHYSFFSEQGLTIHSRGLSALVRFIGARAELFRSLYFHRTVRSIDLTLSDLFADGKELLFPGNPLEMLDEYQRFTEWSLLVDVARWSDSDDPKRRQLGQRWRRLLAREVHWRMAAERTVFFDRQRSADSTIFSRDEFFLAALRDALPATLRSLELRVDTARHVHRPGTRGPATGQNFLFDSARNEARTLDDDALYRRIPQGFLICRVYAESAEHDAALAAALDRLLGESADDPTNM